MNKQIFFLIALLILFFAGGGYTLKKYTQDKALAVREITIKAISGMQYDLVRFKVSPGERIKLTLNNTDEMTHNWLLTLPGNKEAIVSKALSIPGGEKRNYIPEDDAVLAAIPLLKPDENYTISFTAPEKEGVYPYVCTYPGHGSVMYGAMYVTNSLLPPLANDDNIPEQRRNAKTVKSAESGHPFPMVLPAMYRIFMPQSGPASIAVGMLGDISYCWDAGECRLRYVWQGGFVDMERTWAGKGIERADLVGIVFYRETVDFPFRTGNKNHIPKVSFKGYKMKNRYPTFMYELDDIKVTERILPTFDVPGIKRQFTFENLNENIWFKITRDAGVTYQVNQGHWEKAYLKLTPAEARNFTITITEDKSNF